MTITSMSLYRGNARAVIPWRSGTTATSSIGDMRVFSQMNTAAPPALAVISTPANGASGGTLWSNGSTGFPPFPAVASNLGKVVGSLSAASNGFNNLMLYDMIWGCSGFVGNVGTAQTVTGFPVLTRPDANGTFLELMLGIASASSSTSTLITVSYTNQAGTSGRTANLTYGATTRLSSSAAVLPFTLQGNDTGVKSVQSLTIGTVQAAAGSFWLMLGKPLAYISMESPGSIEFRNDIFRGGLAPISANAALGIIGAPSSNGGGGVTLEMEIVQS